MSRRFLVPETLQTSAMDCGPAALKALLAGLEVPVNYERLREECRTGADGTSIDALEDLCVGLGLEAFQEMAPVSDAIDVLERKCPCILVVKGGGGAPHFIVVWRTLGRFVQIMDPARGRQWVPRRASPVSSTSTPRGSTIRPSASGSARRSGRRSSNGGSVASVRPRASRRRRCPRASSGQSTRRRVWCHVWSRLAP